MKRRTPRSTLTDTLLPYTTRFRSDRHIPVVGGSIGDSDVAAFADALEQADGPVLGFCRTGTRSTTLWALGQAGKQPTEAILKTAAAAGYDLAALRPRLDRKSTRLNSSH